MMADEPPLEAVIDQPGIAVRALHAEAAGAAQGQRREAAAVEEEQGLLAVVEIRLKLADERRSEPDRAPFRLDDAREPASVQDEHEQELERGKRLRGEHGSGKPSNHAIENVPGAWLTGSRRR